MRALAPQPEEIRELCRRARAAGLPKAAARPRLLNDYLRLARALGVQPEDVQTGQDLVRASAALLRAPAAPTRPAGGAAPSAV
jgi:hypothetical protein